MVVAMGESILRIDNVKGLTESSTGRLGVDISRMRLGNTESHSIPIFARYNQIQSMKTTNIALLLLLKSQLAGCIRGDRLLRPPQPHLGLHIREHELSKRHVSWPRAKVLNGQVRIREEVYQDEFDLVRNHISARTSVAAHAKVHAGFAGCRKGGGSLELGIISHPGEAQAIEAFWVVVETLVFE
jgi:hypothetical protein